MHRVLGYELNTISFYFLIFIFVGELVKNDRKPLLKKFNPTFDRYYRDVEAPTWHNGFFFFRRN